MKSKNKIVVLTLSILLIILTFILIVLLLFDGGGKEKSIEQNKKEQTEVIKEEKEQEVTVEVDDLEKISQAINERDFEVLKELADRENPNTDIALIVGEMYLQGINTYTDIYEAVKYIEIAALGGNEKAFQIYSEMLFTGEASIIQDYEKAAKYAICIKENNQAAQEMLEVMQAYGMCGEEIDTSDIIIKKIEYQDKKVKKAIENYIDELVSTHDHEDYNEELNNIKNMDKTLVNQIAIFGKDNWLFWKHPNDGDSYHDYVGDNAYSEEEMARIAEKLLEQKKLVEAKGASFVLLLIPNKETVYYEYMPEYIERVDTVTRMDKLVSYLEDNTDINIVYLREDFEQIKNEVDIYYKTDTHTNMQGTFVCMSKLMKNLYDKNLDVKATSFQVHLRDYCGDIGTAINRADKYNIDTVYFLGPEAVREDDKVEDSVLLIGDSFSEFLNIEMQYYFTSGVEHVMVKDYGYNYYNAMNSKIDNLDCDVVIWQLAERFAERLVK